MANFEAKEAAPTCLPSIQGNSVSSWTPSFPSFWVLMEFYICQLFFPKKAPNVFISYFSRLLAQK